MSAFFEPPPPPAEEPEAAPAPWFAPPSGTLPGVVALELVLAQTERVAIYISRLLGYPTGFGFDVVMIAAAGQDDELDMGAALFGHHHRRGRHRQVDALAPERLRLGVQFSDGQKATNVGGFDYAHIQDQPPGPVMHSGGGGGGDRHWHQEQWVWPLPPPGPLSFVCEWPAAGIELTRQEIDAQSILDAAGRARTLFPDQPSGRGGPPPSTVMYGESQIATGNPPPSTSGE